jgi:hypothetical protein
MVVGASRDLLIDFDTRDLKSRKGNLSFWLQVAPRFYFARFGVPVRKTVGVTAALLKEAVDTRASVDNVRHPKTSRTAKLKISNLRC